MSAKVASLFDEADDAEEAAADARAEADVAAGRLISHEAVSRWLDTWGKSEPLPRPQCGE
jgi:predicted transcriptional regulator